ncbi:hypothetical protein [Nannocystis pusilla]|uniref:hypothetical protein n=1 Tax=Nannocystis pusilla TaxID=889268 RepID=UPI003B77C2A2
MLHADLTRLEAVGRDREGGIVAGVMAGVTGVAGVRVDGHGVDAAGTGGGAVVLPGVLAGGGGSSSGALLQAVVARTAGDPRTNSRRCMRARL